MRSSRNSSDVAGNRRQRSINFVGTLMGGGDAGEAPDTIKSRLERRCSYRLSRHGDSDRTEYVSHVSYFDCRDLKTSNLARIGLKDCRDTREIRRDTRESLQRSATRETQTYVHSSSIRERKSHVLRGFKRPALPACSVATCGVTFVRKRATSSCCWIGTLHHTNRGFSSSQGFSIARDVPRHAGTQAPRQAHVTG